MDHRHPGGTDIDPLPHRQRRHLGSQVWKLRGRLLQAAHDRIGALHKAVLDPCGIGTAAPGRLARRTKFGFDIAPGGCPAEHTLVDTLEEHRIDIEPVEITVEHQVGRTRLCFKRAQYRVEGQLIPIESPHDIEDFTRDRRRGGEHRGGIPVVQGTTAAWPFMHSVHSLPSTGRCRGVSVLPRQEHVLQVYALWNSFHTRENLPLRHTVAFELIGNDDAWHVP